MSLCPFFLFNKRFSGLAAGKTGRRHFRAPLRLVLHCRFGPALRPSSA